MMKLSQMISSIVFCVLPEEDVMMNSVYERKRREKGKNENMQTNREQDKKGCKIESLGKEKGNGDQLI